ncbi:ribosome-associated translation inhibitor RaiA [Arenibacter sp. GZD96]|uniref:ribosome hibernation-promoting factor, HPF/YfiA family n=1 Tax=Aurantibrevibacter litoralis TaxID=3106030 RepID=UPI002AFECFC7|nr:ribosome-associated translation inhibitor RaiA [Arenibacter sp. GZD-96]MEA1786386.1 ribosome-associated translation inhibitor RaiA [Arenibacter sp. GZD-96]
MTINFEYDNVKASARLEELAAKKVNKLMDKYHFIVRAHITFKTENTSSTETGMICTVLLSAPGPDLFAQASHGNFEASIAEVTDELERQLRKRKEKMQSH